MFGKLFILEKEEQLSTQVARIKGEEMGKSICEKEVRRECERVKWNGRRLRPCLLRQREKG